MKEVHNYITTIQQYPKRIAVALNVPDFMPRLFKLLNDVIAYSFDLSGRISTQDYKEIGNTGNLAHIQYYCIVCLFILSKLCDK